MNYLIILDDLSATTVQGFDDEACKAIDQGGMALFRPTAEGFEQLEVRSVPSENETYWGKTWRKV